MVVTWCRGQLSVLRLTGCFVRNKAGSAGFSSNLSRRKFECEKSTTAGNFRFSNIITTRKSRSTAYLGRAASGANLIQWPWNGATADGYATSPGTCDASRDWKWFEVLPAK